MMDYNAICWKDIVYYDETSPTSLRWISNRANGKVKANSPAGTLHHTGYSTVNYFNKQYQGHRIVWVLHYGGINNELFIDHIDGNRNNNSINNLRLVTRAENCRNNEYLGSNTGVKGVSYQGRDDVYVASWVDLDKKQKYSYFYCGVHGRENAFILACNARRKAIEDLNSLGAGYTDRHLQIA